MFRKRKITRGLLNNTPMGILIGSLVVCLIGLGVDAGFSDFLSKNLGSFIGGGLTLVAAVLAVMGVLANIDNQNEREEEARQRRLLAARAKLPLALSKMNEVCMFGVWYSSKLAMLISTSGKDVVHLQSLEHMTLSDDVIDTFQVIIENTSDEDVAHRVMALLRDYQIYFSRWNGEFGVVLATDDASVRDRTVWWAYLGSGLIANR